MGDWSFNSGAALWGFGSAFSTHSTPNQLMENETSSLLKSAHHNGWQCVTSTCSCCLLVFKYGWYTCETLYNKYPRCMLSRITCTNIILHNCPSSTQHISVVSVARGYGIRCLSNMPQLHCASVRCTSALTTSDYPPHAPKPFAPRVTDVKWSQRLWGRRWNNSNIRTT